MSASAELILDDQARLRAMDEEDRKNDDTTEGIDWDEIIATTQEDFEAGNFAFNSADYPTHEAAMKAMWEMMMSIVEEVERESKVEHALDAAGT